MPSADPLRTWLRRAGPTPGGRLRDAVGMSQSTMQRALRSMGDELLVVGRTRGTRYALRRAIDGLRTPLDVFEIDETGEARRALTLHPVGPFGHYVEGHVDDVESGFHEADPSDVAPGHSLDLPWFLQDLRPDGFLGRAWLRTHADHGYPPRLSDWTGDDVLRYASLHGADLVGAWCVGVVARDARRPLDRRADILPADQRSRHYPSLAERVLDDHAPGSSLGGEQPKLSVVVEEAGTVMSHMVKFSPPMDHPGGRRWADLLEAEHLAHAVLAEHGIATCRSEVLDAGGRRFLQVQRFDRHGLAGRSGVTSLLPFDRDGVASQLRSWSLVVSHLVDTQRLAPDVLDTVRWLEAFGHGIANTDMHLGNLSLRHRGTRLLGLAPVYDMLPMFHAPRHGGEIRPGVYDPRPVLEQAPPTALDAARTLWARVAASPRVSDGFKRVAEAQAARV